MAQAPVISEAGRSDSDAPTQPMSGMRHHTKPVGDYEGQVRGVLIQLGSSDPDGDINSTRKFLEGCQDAAIDPAVCAANIYTAVKHKHGGGTILREAGGAAEGDAVVRREIIDHMARTLFVSAWADNEEEEGRHLRGELFSQAPPTPKNAEEAARKLTKMIEKANGEPIDALYTRAADAEGKHYRDPTPEDFGYSLAMMALGHGVSWEDNHPPIPLPKGKKFKVPSIDYHLDDALANEAAEVAPVISERKRAGRGTWRVTYTDVRNVRHTAVLSAPDADDAFRQAEADAKDEGRPIDRKFQVTVADHTGRAVAFHENAAEEKGECTTCIPWVKVTRDPHKHAEHMELAAKHGPIKTAKQVYALVGHDLMKDKGEVFLVIPLNVRGELCSPPYEIARGQTSKVHVDSADVLRAALDSGCAGYICCHSHPTGKCKPSRADIALTNEIKAATKPYGKGLCLLDHIVIGNGECFSIFQNKMYKV